MNKHETLQRLTDNLDALHVESAVDSFTTCIYESGLNVFGKTISQHRKYSTNRHKPWYDHECIREKYDFKRARNTFTKLMSVENRKIFVKMRNMYNRTNRKAKYKFKIREGGRLCHISSRER